MADTARAAELVELSNLAGGFASMMTGSARRTMRARSKALFAQAMAAAGPIPADIAAMSDDELLAELEA